MCVCWSLSVVGWFFFSSRRRHTRWPRDWSSDVCSSDLSPTLRHPRATRFPEELVREKVRPCAGGVSFFRHRGSRDHAQGKPIENVVLRGHYRAQFAASRSEERRVGKERRALGGGLHDAQQGG